MEPVVRLRIGERVLEGSVPTALAMQILEAFRAQIEPSTPTLEDVERAHILRVLSETPTMVAAADVLGISKRALFNKRRLYGFD